MPLPATLLILATVIPLISFTVLVFMGRRMGKPFAGWVATAAIAASFFCSVATLWSWVSAGTPDSTSGWGMGKTQTTVSEIPVGQLIVDIADVKAKRFVWRGMASGTISDNPEKVTKLVNKSLDKMFENYPPEKK